MTDSYAVSGAMDKSLYSPGDPMTATLSGSVSIPGSSAAMALTVVIRASDGTTHTLPTFGATINQAAVQLTYAIQSVVDTLGHSWTISADGLSATATA